MKKTTAELVSEKITADAMKAHGIAQKVDMVIIDPLRKHLAELTPVEPIKEGDPMDNPQLTGEPREVSLSTKPVEPMKLLAKDRAAFTRVASGADPVPLVYDPTKITPAELAKVLDSPAGAVIPGPRLQQVEFMPAPIYRLDVPAGGRGLIVCDDPVDADAIRRSFQVRRIPLESCTYGANLTGERFGLIIIAKRPKDDGQERWLKEVVEPCLAKDGTLRRLYV